MRIFRTIRRYASAGGFLFALIVAFLPGAVSANPQQGNVASGVAAMTSSGKTLNIRQASNKVIINWGSFDIAKGETTRFLQPSAASIALNRVMTSGQASRINGSLRANGRIILVNPNGAIFGNAAHVNVGSLIVSSADIDDAVFNAADNVFVFSSPGNRDAAIVNGGKITVAKSGLAAFVAPEVRNTGVIEGRTSRIMLAAGDVFAVDLYGDGLLNLAVASDKGPHQVSAGNSGRIVNDGGSVLMTAVTAGNLVQGIVNTSGHIRARGIGRRNGKIVLTGGRLTAAGTLDVSGDPKGGDGGFVETSGSETLNVAGLHVDASASRGKAGTWLIDPTDIHIVAESALPVHYGDGYISTRTLDDAIANIVLAATRDIFVEENIAVQRQGVGIGMTAGRDLFMNGTGISTQGGDVGLHAGGSLNLNRAIIVTNGGAVTLTAFNPDVRQDGALFLSSSSIDATGGTAAGGIDMQGSGSDAFMQQSDNSFRSGLGGGKILAQAEWMEGRNNALTAGTPPPSSPPQEIQTDPFTPQVPATDPPVPPPPVTDPPASEPPPTTAGNADGDTVEGQGKVSFNASRLKQGTDESQTGGAGGISDGASLLGTETAPESLPDISPAAGGDGMNPVLCANSFLAGTACK